MVVEYGSQSRPLSEHEGGNRDRGLFGDRIGWITAGLESY